MPWLRSSAVLGGPGRKLALIGFLLVGAGVFAGCRERGPEAVFATAAGPIRVVLECAAAPLERARGLMFRDDLEEERGMLFLFPEETRPAFWMKNTFVSLDIVFLARDGAVVDLAERLPPCAADPCQVYQPREACPYALEVKGGFAAKYGIKKGDRVELVLPDGSPCRLR